MDFDKKCAEDCEKKCDLQSTSHSPAAPRKIRLSKTSKKPDKNKPRAEKKNENANDDESSEEGSGRACNFCDMCKQYAPCITAVVGLMAVAKNMYGLYNWMFPDPADVIPDVE